MPRKWGPCAEPRCPVLCSTTYCDVHYRTNVGWKTDRAKRLPKDWAARRRWTFLTKGRWCYLCGEAATEVDHVVAGDNHDVSNLAPICGPCHRSKSGHEGGITQGRFT